MNILQIAALGFLVANTNPTVDYTIEMQGNCQYKLAVGKLRTGFGPCNDQVWYTLAKGTVAISFFTSESSSISLMGRGDRQPNLNNYFAKIQMVIVVKNTGEMEPQANYEGECHISLNDDATIIYFIKCNAFNRKKKARIILNVVNIWSQQIIPHVW